MKKGFVACLIMFLLVGCAQKIVFNSVPKQASGQNDYYSVILTPKKEMGASYTYFRLEVKNNSSQPLAIDWNQTRYLYDGQQAGIFVFAGMDPMDIRNATIPNTPVDPGQTFVRDIAPGKLVALDALRPKADQQGLSAGPLPGGKSSLMLVVLAGGKKVAQTLTVDIREEKGGH